MPACSSDVFSSGTRHRSSSPPTSRSNSASPQLSWQIGPDSSMMSTSPSQTLPTGTSKKSVSNQSNSSWSLHGRTFCSEQYNEDFGKTTGIPENSTFVSNPEEFRRYRTIQASSKTDEQLARNLRRLPRSSEPAETCERSLIKTMFFPAEIIDWYTNLVFHLFRRLNKTLSYVVWAPIIWISAWICVFWVLMQLPLNAIKLFIRVLYTPSSERSRNNKRCVLITGGSTVQALHLARNFYRAGARVVVCEIEGLFGLVRFSTACSRYYNVPRPGPGTVAEYVNALKTIVEREKVLYFIPVSCTSRAYYDSLAKPHLEMLGCECFVPGAAEVTSLEDPLQLIQRCSSLGLPNPTHRVVTSFEDLIGLYEINYFGTNQRHVMISAGPSGMTDRAKFRLPNSVDNAITRNLRRKFENYEISEQRPWLIIRDATGICDRYHLVTCTTVKDSKVVANVTCRLDETTRGLVPEERNDVDQWLQIFFRGFLDKRINGHLSFKLAFNRENNRELTPISCRVGVSLPYLCLTSVHSRLVWRPCRHFSRQNSVNLIVNEKYKKVSPMNHRSASTDGLFSRLTMPVQNDKNPTARIKERNDDGGHFAMPSSATLDKRDVLFVCWDPLPYCAYYHLQFPFRRLAGAIRERPPQHKPPLAVVQ